MSSVVRLSLCATALAMAAWSGGGGDPPVWNLALLALGIAGVTSALLRPTRDTSSTSSRLILVSAVMCPVYVGLQLLPLPLSLLRIVDGTRADIAHALQGVGFSSAYASLSIVPAKTWVHLSRFAGYGLVFFLVREAALRARSLWVPALPLLLIAGIEAVLGLMQESSGAATISGTYYNKNHFAGLLEMVLPFALMYGIAILSRRKRSHVLLPAAVAACGLMALAAVMFAAIAFSLSKMAFFSTISALALMAMLATASRLRGARRWAAAGATVVSAVVAFGFLSPVRLIEGLGGAAFDPTAEGRWPIAKDTLRLIGAYPLFGSGLGTYFPALLPYQTFGLNLTWINAHNDGLELLAGLGIIGFSILVTFVGAVLARAIRTATSEADQDLRFFGLACAGGLAVMVIHSFGDFNMFVPANAMALSWIAGMSSALPGSVRLRWPKWQGANSSFVRNYVLALGCLASLYAGGWLLYLHRFQGNVRTERIFCTFGICDSNTVLASLQSAYGGKTANIPPANLVELLRRDAAAYYRWCDLAESLQKAGRIEEARACFKRAEALGPHIPSRLLRTARFHFGIGETGKGFAMAVRALESARESAPGTFDVYDEFHLGNTATLAHGLPPDAEIWRSYLRRQLVPRWADDAIEVWNELVPRGYADDQSASEVVEFLIGNNRIDAAHHAWVLYAASRSEGYPDTNGVFNGDFELEPTKSRFDWHLSNNPGFSVSIDPQVAHSGKRAARIRFDGTTNVATETMSTSAYLPSGRYTFQAYVKTEGITTNRSLAFEIVGAGLKTGAQVLHETMETSTGTNDWTLVQRDFQVPADTGLVSVRVRRTASLKFDNKIKGTAWIDDVRILPDIASAAARPTATPTLAIISKAEN